MSGDPVKECLDAFQKLLAPLPLVEMMAFRAPALALNKVLFGKLPDIWTFYPLTEPPTFARPDLVLKTTVEEDSPSNPDVKDSKY